MPILDRFRRDGPGRRRRRSMLSVPARRFRHFHRPWRRRLLPSAAMVDPSVPSLILARTEPARRGSARTDVLARHGAPFSRRARPDGVGPSPNPEHGQPDRWRPRVMTSRNPCSGHHFGSYAASDRQESGRASVIPVPTPFSEPADRGLSAGVRPGSGRSARPVPRPARCPGVRDPAGSSHSRR